MSSMSKNKIIHLPVAPLADQGALESHSGVIVEIPNITQKPQNQFSGDKLLPLSNYDEKTRKELLSMITGHTEGMYGVRDKQNDFIRLESVPLSSFQEAISEGDPLHDRVDYLDELVKAIAPTIGVRNANKIASAMIDAISESFELGKFSALLEESQLAE